MTKSADEVLKDEGKRTVNKLIPVPGKIIVREDAFKYQGLIEIPDKLKRRPTTGVIVGIGYGVGRWEQPAFTSVGPGIEVQAPGEPTFIPYYEVGQRLIYGLYSGTVIQIKGEPVFRVLGMDEVLAVITNESTDFELEAVGS